MKSLDGPRRGSAERRRMEQLRRELKRIKDTATANGQLHYNADGEFEYAVAPGGERSRLNEKQWLETRTTSFKSWFGDWEKDPETASKLVDENGEPLVFYHGTTRTFDSFSHDAPKTFDLENVRGAFFFTSDRSFAEAEYGKFKENLIMNTLRKFNEVFFEGQATNWDVLIDKWNDFVRSIGDDRVNFHKEVSDGRGGHYNWTLVEFDGQALFPTDELGKIWDSKIPDHFEPDDYEVDSWEGKEILLPKDSKQIVMELFINSKNPNYKAIDNEHDQLAMDNLFAHGMIERGVYATDQPHILGDSSYGSMPETDAVVVRLTNGQQAVAIFEPNQVKSAQRNSGMFNAGSTSIYA